MPRELHGIVGRIAWFPRAGRGRSALAMWLLTSVLPQAYAASPDCLDSEAALHYWRPIKEQAPTSEKPQDPLAVELVSCLSSPVPELRDQIGYELFTYWLRNDRLTDETRRTLLAQLSALMNRPPARVADDAALSRSFSTLTLAELMRSDSEKPFMRAGERKTLLADAIAALDRENDFRGLDVEIGWIHPVAT